MSRIKYRSQGGPTKSQFKARDEVTRPENPKTGDIIREIGKALVFNGRDWAWFPSVASDLMRLARAYGWGRSVTVRPEREERGWTDEGEMIVKKSVKVILLLGREPGPTTNGRTSKGYTYRLVWDTSANGTFELISWFRRTSTHPNWAEIGSIAEIHPIMSRYPVIPETTENETEEGESGE